MTRDFDELIGTEGLPEGERARLERVHAMLLAAGPPPDLTLALQRAPQPAATRRTPRFAGLLQRPMFAAAGYTTVVAAACFGVGFVLGNTSTSANVRVVGAVSMQGTAVHNEEASIKVGAADSDGNWPLELKVDNLPRLANKSSYYVLALERKGQRSLFCGMFTVSADGTTNVRFSVPYKITKSSKWVVTAMTPSTDFPGHVVMTTT